MALQQPPAADDILAEVFQQLENNGNFELNFNQLIPPGILQAPFSYSASVAEASEKSKSSSKHKRKHSKKKSAKKKKSNKEDAMPTATASLGSTPIVERHKKDSLHQEHLPKINKTKKSKRSRSSDKRKHSSKVQSPSRKKHKNDQNKDKKVLFSNPKLKAEIVEPKQNEFNDDDNHNKSSVEKRMEEMYEEYERTMNPASDHSGIKAVSLKDYLKSKGYLMKENELKIDTTKTSDSTKQKTDPKHSLTKPARPLSSSSFIPRNLKVTKLISSTDDDSKTATNCETERKVVMENISDDEDSVTQAKAVEENSITDDAAKIQLEISPENTKIVSNLIDSGTNDAPAEGEHKFSKWSQKYINNFTKI